MGFIIKIIYFFVFIILALGAMFLGGLAGVTGTFYLMVEPGDLQHNLMVYGGALIAIWLLVLLLRRQNIKVLKRNKQLSMEGSQKDAP